ncbi:hypothetical protein A2867_00315 [Candidatus Daviesbacteria bacterium RIFCSPHIGHO2_01_FULL_40_11]|uniref:Uncharacterized protein n=1 Tax=Candidatus Daviesbacteria bacterium RIFCSPHIGHO2_01_FULL_40_11 TaxID=1797762 RepID=A0A1F5JLQ1_9BACT|nr:MAG: hypothetical protein A2867_00315 [Candidatus Daviesbacteria bacterium RIFCSPHIGHO2_01_FULL_40_11]OGE62602.1 MAG: hypothetical protein A2964_00205 [Candidatus Daviesbacteria bacterium RIFCSPLOWO2_01_FULL_40_27]
MSEIVFNAPITSGDLQTQVESMQTTLASLNQQVIILQEALQERDQKIKDLEMRLSECKGVKDKEKLHTDNTLTIVGVLINLYKFLFPPGKAA